MTISVGASVAVGIYTVTVTGTGGGTNASTTVAVNVPEPAPTTFTLTAPSGAGFCTEAQEGYTCSASNNAVNLQTDNLQDSACLGLAEQYQYCLVQGVTLNGFGLIPPSACGTANPWTTSPPLTYTLPSASGVYNVYAEYAVVCGGHAYMSYPAPFQITLNSSTPAAVLNTPSGIPAQTQYLNFAVPQDMTYWAATTVAPIETVTAYFYGCSATPSSCSSPAILGSTSSPASTQPPYVWTFSGLTAADNYVWLTVIDQSGGTNQAASPATSFFDPTNSSGPPGIACGVANSGGTQICLPVADGTGGTGANTISNDQPSPAASVEVSYMGTTGTVTQLFSGYADPSVRLDPYPVVGTGGGYLWMLYSYPKLNQYTNSGNNPTIPYYGAAVETHLASSVPASSGSSADASGLSWGAYCSGGCTGSNVTPIYPSVETATKSPNLVFPRGSEFLALRR